MNKLVALALAIASTLTVAAQSGSHVHAAWTPPTTTLAFGQNLYRATANSSGVCPAFSTTAYTKIQGSINATVTSTDDYTVASNVTYCYAVTAYDTTGSGTILESDPSNIASVTTGTITKKLPSPSGLGVTFIQ